MGEAFDFRELHPDIRIGTASDRYAGWIGQIYTPGRYESAITRRARSLGGKRYVEEVLPPESAGEYFRHFPVLEIDFTFYRPLLTKEGRPTDNYRLLEGYLPFLDGAGELILKAPQIFTSPTVLRRGGFTPNSDYLDSAAFRMRFLEPAKQILGDSLRGILVEQPYRPSRERPASGDHARELERFFGKIPCTGLCHLEVRTEALIEDHLLEVLGKSGVGLVLSHWTWLPGLAGQYARAGKRSFSSDGRCLIRLLTPRGRRYEESYAMAFPFDRMVEGMESAGMVEETVGIMRDAVDRGKSVTIIVNNRAGGNAPLIARRIADRFGEG